MGDDVTGICPTSVKKSGREEGESEEKKSGSIVEDCGGRPFGKPLNADQPAEEINGCSREKEKQVGGIRRET